MAYIHITHMHLNRKSDQFSVYILSASLSLTLPHLVSRILYNIYSTYIMQYAYFGFSLCISLFHFSVLIQEM